MARLDSQIEALIQYANEVTGASDSKLGDAVKTLADGYNGGGNDVPLPTITDADALSSQITALITYANGITGKNDTSIGDVVRSLAEGYGGGGAPRLPEEYQEVEYLQNSGTQYIDTGLTGDLVNLTVEMEAKYVAESRDYQFLAGYNSGSQIGTAVFKTWTCERASSVTSAFVKTHIYMYFDSVFHAVLNGTEEISRPDGGQWASFRTYSYSLFTAKSYNNLYGISQGAVIYWCKMTYNGVLVRDLVPCYRKADGKTGMYDIVNDVFYTDAAGGEFIVGADVN